MEKDEKNIENIEELADFEEQSLDVSMDSMFSDDVIEEATEENAEEDSSLVSAQEEIVSEEIEETIQELTEQNTIEEFEPIEEIKEEPTTAVIEEHKPKESYVTTMDDFEQVQESEKMITVRPVKFQEFEQTSPNRSIKKNLDILQDVSMHVSVELGRTKSSIKDVMEMEQGSIVELDKVAGEQVEIFVNEKLVAKGEVIVIEDKFGVRVTSTSFPKDIT